MKLSEFVKNYRKQHKVTQQELADRAGLTKGFISQIENEYSPSGKAMLPSIPTLSKLAQAMNIDMNTFLNSVDTEISLNDSSVTELPIIYNDYFPLHYSTNLSAGSLDELLDAEPDAVVYVPIKFQFMKNRLCAFQINGDSMNNVIKDKSIVIVENTHASIGTRIPDGTIVVAFIDGQATVKRFYFNPPLITLMPDSSEKTFLPIVINTEVTDVAIIGRVIWHMNPEDMLRYY